MHHYLAKSIDFYLLVFLKRKCTFHTHGLKENFNHSDIQVVLPVDSQTIHPILIMMVEQVKEGKVFETDKKDSQVLQRFDVIFKEFEEETELFCV